MTGLSLRFHEGNGLCGQLGKGGVGCEDLSPRGATPASSPESSTFSQLSLTPVMVSGRFSAHPPRVHISSGWTALCTPSVNPHSVIEVLSSKLFGHPVLTVLLPHRAHCPCSWVTLHSSFYVMGSSLLSPPPSSN